MFGLLYCDKNLSTKKPRHIFMNTIKYDAVFLLYLISDNYDIRLKGLSRYSSIKRSLVF